MKYINKYMSQLILALFKQKYYIYYFLMVVVYIVIFIYKITHKHTAA